MKAKKHKSEPKSKSKRNYCIAAIIIVILAVIFVLAQQEPLSVNGKDKTKVPDNAANPAPTNNNASPALANAPANAQVIAKLKPHLDAEPELANSSYKKSSPTIEILSKESLAKKASENPAIYAGAMQGNYEIRYNDLLVLFDYESDKINGIFIIDNVTIGQDQN